MRPEPSDAATVVVLLAAGAAVAFAVVVFAADVVAVVVLMVVVVGGATVVVGFSFGNIGGYLSGTSSPFTNFETEEPAKPLLTTASSKMVSSI